LHSTTQRESYLTLWKRSITQTSTQISTGTKQPLTLHNKTRINSHTYKTKIHSSTCTSQPTRRPSLFSCWASSITSNSAQALLFLSHQAPRSQLRRISAFAASENAMSELKERSILYPRVAGIIGVLDENLLMQLADLVLLLGSERFGSSVWRGSGILRRLRDDRQVLN